MFTVQNHRRTVDENPAEHASGVPLRDDLPYDEGRFGTQMVVRRKERGMRKSLVLACGVVGVTALLFTLVQAVDAG